jgi:hypothetical protein
MRQEPLDELSGASGRTLSDETTAAVNRPTVLLAPRSEAAADIARELAAAADRIAYLEGKVEVLEAALTQRSRQLRLIEERLCRRDQVIVARLLAGLPALPTGTFDPAFWRETTALAQADVATVLNNLWSSIGLPDTGSSPQS